MPDLQSELAKVLTQKQFDDEPGAPVVQVDKKISRRETIWNYVRDNPASTATEVGNALNIDATQVATELLRLEDKGIVDRAQSSSGRVIFAAVGSEYPRFDRSAHMKAMLAKSKVAKAAKAKSVKKPKPKPIKWVDDKPAAPPKFDADAILSNLNVLQARELMDKLRKLFGG